MKKIRIAQIGVCHEHASGKIGSLKKLPELFELVGVVDDNSFSVTPKYSGHNLAPYEGIPKLTLDEVFHYPGLEAVTVEVPNNELVAMAKKCAERGLAMHMDKPGGVSLPAYKEVLDIVEAKKLPFQMGFMFRNNPAFLFVIDSFRKGMLGEIISIEASMNHDYGTPAYDDYLGAMQGGIMYNLGCHFFDLIVTLMGRPDNIWSSLKSCPGFPDNVKNNCLAVLEYPHATATVRSNAHEVGGTNPRRLRVVGTKGTIEFAPLEHFDNNPMQVTLRLKEDGFGYQKGTQTVDCDPIPDRYVSQLTEFARIIRGEMADPYTRAHDLLVHEISLAASGYFPWHK